ncbi:23S rRNA (pseudouridine(1915)-N(3))-methyltransferase RlmH [Peptoniphilus raoultii]|uniref:23S rRNA (pseudouridine(1915)-N(3))-methyltransferase RlmH n=1 Tax=Peptoniphilus raoultii TaxID=1776387 RepID=UPI0008DA4CC0|nr:23S rRNA (pseudouridine(1915)-N(3))-methyltransferase RlmH [Peptoniphilus raoultii]
MEINIISVGKIKESYFLDGIDEYKKRMGPYCSIKFTQLKDEPAGENISPKDEEIILNKEGERILEKIKDEDYVIVLDLSGKTMDSLAFAKKFEGLMVSGIGKIDFVIGGSLGLSEDVKKRGNFSLSFSKFTFPHKLMKLILMEQIYRAFRIINNHPYHK